jgi:DNA-binding NarL/FixJ family response regulator
MQRPLSKLHPVAGPRLITNRASERTPGNPTVPVMPDCETYLSPRELDVVRLVVEGLGNQEIGDRLGVSRRTIHAHIANAMRKTETHTRTQLAVLALRAGLVPLPPPESTDD